MPPLSFPKVFLRPTFTFHLPAQVRPLHTTRLPHFQSTLPRIAAPQSRLLPLIAARGVASTVSNKPGSQTFPHAAQNIKEETGNSAIDLAKSISGNVPLPDYIEPGRESFVSPYRSTDNFNSDL